MSAASRLEAEQTAAGAQMLVPGVRPVSQRERLEARMTAPLLPPRPQHPADFGLFDEAARHQLDLFGSPARPIADPELPP